MMTFVSVTFCFLLLETLSMYPKGQMGHFNEYYSTIINRFFGGGGLHSLAHGILVPQAGAEPGPSAVKLWSPKH